MISKFYHDNNNNLFCCLGISGLKRTLQYEEHEHTSNWSKHARQSPQVSSEGGNIANLSFATHPQLITMPAQGIQSTLSGGQMGRFLILYSIPPTSHLPQFPNGTLLQQSSMLSGTTVDPQQLNISGPQIVQAAPTNGLNYATMAQPFLVQGNPQPHLLGGATLLPTIGNSALFNGMVLMQPSMSNPLVCGHIPESLESPSAKVSTATSPAAGSRSSTPGNSMTMETADSDKIRHLPRPPPPPPPLLQLNPQVRVSSLADGTKVSVLSPPLPAQSSLSGPIIQSQVPNCIQRLVILGDMGKSQGATTMLVPAPGDQDQGKAYGATHMMYDPHQMVSSIPLYRFGSSHPIQILTPVGASVKKS